MLRDLLPVGVGASGNAMPPRRARQPARPDADGGGKVALRMDLERAVTVDRQANCSTREGIFGKSVSTSSRRSDRTHTSGNTAVSSSRLR